MSLTLSRRRSLTYRNQSIDSLCKSMNCFLCDKDLHHERVKHTVNWIIRNYAFLLFKMFVKTLKKFKRITFCIVSTILEILISDGCKTWPRFALNHFCIYNCFLYLIYSKSDRGLARRGKIVPKMIFLTSICASGPFYFKLEYIQEK